MHRILITGASGLLGSNLATNWSALASVIGVSHRTVVRQQLFTTLQTDLTSSEDTAILLRDVCPTVVVHAAGLADVDLCEAQFNLAELHNVHMTRNVARGAQAIGAKLVYISTDAVYDGNHSLHTEISPVSPINVYARTKLLGEAAAVSEAPEALVIRTNFYGWNLQQKTSLAEWMLARLEENESVPGFNDVFFTPILVNSLSDILFSLIENDAKGVYNVGGRERLSKYSFAVQLAKQFGFPAKWVQRVSIRTGELLAPRPSDTSLTCGKVTRAVGREMPGIGEDLQRFQSLSEGYRTFLRSLLVTH